MPSSPEQGPKPEAENVAREALKFVLSPQGSFFRDFLMTEIVQSIDALSRKQVKDRAASRTRFDTKTASIFDCNICISYSYSLHYPSLPNNCSA